MWCESNVETSRAYDNIEILVFAVRRDETSLSEFKDLFRDALNI